MYSLAYHILGEIQEAEDVVQDVFESWFSKRPDVEFPKAYLSRAVVNRSVDRLEKLKKTRASYKGSWLPVPIVSEVASGDESISDPLPYALLSLLEKLNPLERAAFILRHAFDTDYSEIAVICDMPEDNVRQMVHRAQEKLQKPRTRYSASIEERQRLLNAFLQAMSSADVTTLKNILHQDVIMYSDGGGKVAAAPMPLHGPDKIFTFLNNILKSIGDRFDVMPIHVNGSPGILFRNHTTGAPDTIFTIDTDGSTITSLYLIRNPDKIHL